MCVQCDDQTAGGFLPNTWDQQCTTGLLKGVCPEKLVCGCVCWIVKWERDNFIFTSRTCVCLVWTSLLLCSCGFMFKALSLFKTSKVCRLVVYPPVFLCEVAGERIFNVFFVCVCVFLHTYKHACNQCLFTFHYLRGQVSEWGNCCVNNLKTVSCLKCLWDCDRRI